ncbi:MAG TPA: SRPBCC domain-containing protein [Gemmatimonadales bacterium]|nr:SRPBCC domain-containing protein [Gemmatimonadales bacterium]
MPRRRITLERTYEASIDDVWSLWTTKDGIESWWGPEGFAVKVRTLDLRTGGELVYAMTAVAPAQAEFLKKAGMPLTTEARVTYTEVVTKRRLAYTLRADFIPGVEPYAVATTVELQPSAGRVRMVLTFDAMHDEQWTQRAVMGRESELTKLAQVLSDTRARSGRS